MAINFPDSPTVDQQFSFEGTSWIWDGDAWNLYIDVNIVTSAQLSATLSSYQRNISYSASEPVSPISSDLWIDSTVANNPILKVYNGTAWIIAGSSGSVEVDSDQIVISQRMFMS
jgi:hypothetical protein